MVQSVVEEMLNGSGVLLVSPQGRLKEKLHRLLGLHAGSVLHRKGDWAKLGGGAAYYRQYVRLENISE